MVMHRETNAPKTAARTQAQARRASASKTNPRACSPTRGADARGLSSPASRGRRALAAPAVPDGFDAFAAAIRDELAPEGHLQSVLADVAARAAWSLGHEDQPRPIRRRTELVLLRAFEALAALRKPRPAEPVESPGVEPLVDEERLARCAPYHVEGLGDDADASTADETPAAPGPEDDSAPIAADGRWRSRLTFDPEVSESSPVVRGTWVTASRVVGLVVDGWTWADILRAHPELTEDDLRACLAYTVEQEDGFRPGAPR
jgi:uncharacterized protein (DUF433 family)